MLTLGANRQKRAEMLVFVLILDTFYFQSGSNIFEIFMVFYIKYLVSLVDISSNPRPVKTYF